jgi:uncharacterized membrane protein YeaQ/YmgE (transglycosylase-associated protein family)
MGSVGPTHLISLLLAVAINAAICGFIASAVLRRKRRRARGLFLLGFLCGFIANPILRRRRRGLNMLGAVARCADVCPPQWRSRASCLSRRTDALDRATNALRAYRRRAHY